MPGRASSSACRRWPTRSAPAPRALEPLHALIRAHVLAAERLHGDDTTVPVLAKGKTETARLWIYVRDDRPFGGGAPPAALFYFSRDREMAPSEPASRRLAGHPAGRCLWRLQRALSRPTAIPAGHRARCAGPCPAQVLRTGRHRRRTPARGKPAARHLARRAGGREADRRHLRHRARDQRTGRRRSGSPPGSGWSGPWSTSWTTGCAPSGARCRSTTPSPRRSTTCSRGRWDAFTRFLDDGRICLTNNAAERALRGIALGRKSWLFAGSERGGDRAAFMYTLIVTAKMNDVDPQAWLADVLARLPDTTRFAGAGPSAVELADLIGAPTRRLTAAYAGCLRLFRSHRPFALWLFDTGQHDFGASAWLSLGARSSLKSKRPRNPMSRLRARPLSLTRYRCY